MTEQPNNPHSYEQRFFKLENWPDSLIKHPQIYKDNKIFQVHCQTLINDIIQTYPDIKMCKFISSDFEPKIAVDIGANLGFFAVNQGSGFDEVHAFEPCSVTFDVSTMISRINTLFGTSHGPRFYTYKLAAHSETGKIIKISPSFGADGTSEPGGNQHHSLLKDQPESVANKIIPVERCLTIALPEIFELIGHEYIDYLKIDAEGAEYPFLIDQDLTNIGIIGMEFHQCNWEQYTEAQLLNHLSKYMYVFCPVGVNANMLLCMNKNLNLSNVPTYTVMSEIIEAAPTSPEELDKVGTKHKLHFFDPDANRWTEDWDIEKLNNYHTK